MRRFEPVRRNELRRSAVHSGSLQLTEFEMVNSSNTNLNLEYGVSNSSSMVDSLIEKNKKPMLNSKTVNPRL
jgi:hypothetical protein